MPLHLHVPIPGANSPPSLLDEIAISSGNGVKGLEMRGLEPGAVKWGRLNENVPRLNAKWWVRVSG